jgi:sugar phosphate isomerase/epimerase
LQIAERLDAKILRIALDGNDVQTSDDNIAKEFKNILPIAEKFKCKIAIENHFAFPSARMANIIKLVDHDYLGACLDVANSICAGEWPDETIDCLSDHTINLHIKDYQFKLDPYGVGFCIEGAPMGDGLTNIRSLLSKFIDKEISIIYEHWLPWTGNFEEARKNEDQWTAEGAAYLTSLTSKLIQNQ